MTDKPLIYVLCTSRKIGRLAVDVDAHVHPDHPAIRYVSEPGDLTGVPRESLFIDLLNRGPAPADIVRYLRADVRSRQCHELEIWRLKSKLRELGLE